MEPSICIFWQNMAYCSKNIPFLLRFNDVLKRYLQKEKTGQAISYSDSRLSALRADTPLVNRSQNNIDQRSLYIEGV
jgi:hypothetical protein